MNGLPPIPRKQKHPLFQIWRGMVRRCYDKSTNNYHNYGARGITVCERWRHSFEAFVADMPPRPSMLHTIDRDDNDGNYEPGNVSWATKAQQRRNSRASPDVLPGMKLSEVSAVAGIARSTLKNRLYQGWSPEKAASEAPQYHSPNGTVMPLGYREQCVAAGINYNTVQSRLRRGWSIERALSEPSKTEHNKWK